MDLAQLAPKDDGARLELKNPATGEVLKDDKGEPMWIELSGRNSLKWRRAEQAVQNRRIERVQGKRNFKVTSELVEAEEIEKLAAVTLWWNIVYNGERPECNPANAIRVYSEVPQVFEQAAVFQANPENFPVAGASA